MSPSGDLACNPGLCPNWESNWLPWSSQAGTESTESHQPGLPISSLKWGFGIHYFSVLFKIFLLLFNYSCPSFPPITLPCSTHPLPSTFSPPHLFVHGSFIHVPWLDHSPSFLHYPSLPSGHCQFVLYFHVSVSVFLACLFCWLGSTYRWDHMLFVFHWLAYFT